MFSEEKITKALSRDELHKLMWSYFNGAYFLLLAAYYEPEAREKFPEEAERYAKERQRIKFISSSIQEHASHITQRFLDVMSDKKATDEERMLAATKLVIFRQNRANRLDKVIEHRYKNMVEWYRNKHLNEPSKGDQG
jgi:hypothetical protein